ncbi:beta-propeller fold lactonase family protein [Chondrinema litorale]|uniref:beta-propeller fold lactonase family protein n=1 Tax=Chondrinema litorale TaxID=2994555 RepID=UPI002543A180|nr:beta-propeller fold lactonase family protein [Chondrinema litorale]UZR94121.1 beta-propeller fold lactonase family protein [Chondrinema litorale]
MNFININKKVAWLIFIIWILNSAFLLFTLFKGQEDKPEKKIKKSVKFAEKDELDTAPSPSKRKKNNTLPVTIKKPVDLALVESKNLKAGQGVKSVVFGQDDEFLYSMNLEEMSISEFSRDKKEISRTLKFHPTKAKGYNYQEKKWFTSFAEKPVEACFTNGGKYMWISLHNAGGVALWNMEKDTIANGKNYLQATLVDHENDKRKKISLRFFETGKTPKFIAVTPDERYLFVSNWHDNNISVIDISSSDSDNWFVVQNLDTGSVPRGMAISQEGKLLYVANMGSGIITIYDTWSFKKTKEIYVGATPRHLIIDNNYLYVTLSSPEKLLKLSLDSLKIVASASTLDDPRTIAFSGDSSMIFTTCYADNKIQAFDRDSLKVMGSWDSPGKPVGIDVYQKDSLLEAWVCNYTGASIKVFTFKITFQEEIAIIEPVLSSIKE